MNNLMTKLNGEQSIMMIRTVAQTNNSQMATPTTRAKPVKNYQPNCGCNVTVLGDTYKRCVAGTRLYMCVSVSITLDARSNRFARHMMEVSVSSAHQRSTWAAVGLTIGKLIASVAAVYMLVITSEQAKERHSLAKAAAEMSVPFTCWPTNATVCLWLSSVHSVERLLRHQLGAHIFIFNSNHPFCCKPFTCVASA